MTRVVTAVKLVSYKFTMSNSVRDKPKLLQARKNKYTNRERLRDFLHQSRNSALLCLTFVFDN